MAKIRVEKTKDYTVMSNYHLRDKTLSLKAKGLMSFMLSLPEDWDYSVDGLSKVLLEGKDAISNAIKELEKCGYLTRTQQNDKQGRFSGYEYVLKEKPTMDKPLSEEPLAENPLTVNPLQLNTNIQSTKELNTKYIKESTKETEIFNYWNNKNIIVHQKLTELILAAIKKALKTYSVEEIETAIDRYDMVLKDKDYFFSYVWSLKDFLSRQKGIADFLDDGEKWINYTKKQGTNKEDKQSKEQSYDELFSIHNIKISDEERRIYEEYERGLKNNSI